MVFDRSFTRRVGFRDFCHSLAEYVKAKPGHVGEFRVVELEEYELLS